MRLFRRTPREEALPSAYVPEGMRVYAIGDVHGRLDLLRALLALIQADNAARVEAETHVILLGDLIDRGPDSAGILDFLLNHTPGWARFHQLMGNHEQMLVDLLADPSAEAMAHFLKHGGRETFESYATPQRLLDLADRMPPEEILSYVPRSHRRFLRNMADAIRVGDYLFVHAGIRPDVPLEDQAPGDIRWIRKPFLDSDADHGVVVVHGHTITPQPVIRFNRIGIDTGAYLSGTLTALGVEGSERWLIATEGDA